MVRLCHLKERWSCLKERWSRTYPGVERDCSYPSQCSEREANQSMASERDTVTNTQFTEHAYGEPNSSIHGPGQHSCNWSEN